MCVYSRYIDYPSATLVEGASPRANDSSSDLNPPRGGAMLALTRVATPKRGVSQRLEGKRGLMKRVGARAESGLADGGDVQCHFVPGVAASSTLSVFDP